MFYYSFTLHPYIVLCILYHTLYAILFTLLILVQLKTVSLCLERQGVMCRFLHILNDLYKQSFTDA